MVCFSLFFFSGSVQLISSSSWSDDFLDVLSSLELLFLKYTYFLLLLFLIHCSHLEMFFKEILKLWHILWHKAFILNDFMSGVEGSTGTQCKNEFFLRSYLQSWSPYHIWFLSQERIVFPFSTQLLLSQFLHWSSTNQLVTPFVVESWVTLPDNLFQCVWLLSNLLISVKHEKMDLKNLMLKSLMSVFNNSLAIHLLLTHRFITMYFLFFLGRIWNIKTILHHGTCTVVFWFRCSKIMNSSKNKIKMHNLHFLF